MDVKVSDGVRSGRGIMAAAEGAEGKSDGVGQSEISQWWLARIHHWPKLGERRFVS